MRRGAAPGRWFPAPRTGHTRPRTAMPVQSAVRNSRRRHHSPAGSADPCARRSPRPAMPWRAGGRRSRRARRSKNHASSRSAPGRRVRARSWMRTTCRARMWWRRHCRRPQARSVWLRGPRSWTSRRGRRSSGRPTRGASPPVWPWRAPRWRRWSRSSGCSSSRRSCAWSPTTSARRARTNG